MEIGIYTFGDVPLDPETGKPVGSDRRMKNLLEEMRLADEAGLDVFALGEHHRPDYLISAPVVALAAGAAITERIRLSTAVTILSSDDPVRVFQAFSTLDLVSGGRAEIMAGRGSFIESFPLFGYSLDDYDALFSEKLDLLMKLLSEERVTWQGRHRSPLNEQTVYPRPVQRSIPLWIAVGGTPQSVVRAATLGLPLAVAIIGGHWSNFGGFVNLYRDAAQRAGHDPSTLPVSINSHGFVAKDSQTARDIAYPHHAEVMNRIGRERGWPPTSRAHFEAMTEPEGAYLVGSPQEVVDKILAQHELFGHQRFLIQMGLGRMPHDELMKAIELLGTEVAPAVRKALGVEAG